VLGNRNRRTNWQEGDSGSPTQIRLTDSFRQLIISPSSIAPSDGVVRAAYSMPHLKRRGFCHARRGLVRMGGAA